jgi:biopolymer transport protein ExbD
MAGTLGKPGHGPIIGINVTPMVDVVLVLLVIMMVSATYIVSQSLKVELPKAASANEAVASLAAVTLTKDGNLYYNQQPITEPELITKFRQALAANEDMSLIVSADQEVPHGKVVHVIDLAKLEGIAKFAINVEPAK